MEVMNVDKYIHFIWFGEITLNQIEYIFFWKKKNSNYEIFFWYDSGAFLCQQLNSKVRCENSEIYLMRRNAIFDDIDKTGKTIDDFVISSIEDGFERISYRKKISDSYYVINELKKYCVVKDIRIELCREIKMYPYDFEIKFRGNLAAASDIVRLIVLFKYGGVYIDVDTLPVKPLGDIEVKENLMYLSGDNHDLGHFYSNVLITHSGSLVVKECLIEINRIYEYINKCYLNLDDDINTYRLDGIYNNSRITLKVTGPGVLYNCIFNRVRDYYPMVDDIEEFIKQYLIFNNHNLNTPLSSKSTWMFYNK